MTDDKPRIEFNWVQASAASLAAVTSAVLLSTFGITVLIACLVASQVLSALVANPMAARVVEERIAAPLKGAAPARPISAVFEASSDDAGVAEKFLYSTKVGTAVEKMSGEGVTERVRVRAWYVVRRCASACPAASRGRRKPGSGSSSMWASAACRC